MEDNDALTVEEALEHSVNARNNEIEPNGFSPNQLVYGEGNTIRGITDGNPATEETLTENEAVFRHFKNKMEDIEAFYKN